MKKMVTYFLICAAVLVCIAGCLTAEPSLQATQPGESNVATQPGESNTATGQGGSESETVEGTEPEFTVPAFEPEQLADIDREKTGLPVEFDPDREFYILISQNDIIYPMRWNNNRFAFRIFSKTPLDVDSISVEVPISHPYEVKVRELQPGGVEEVDQSSRMGYSGYYNKESFTYPLYLAYLGKDFREMAQIQYTWKQALRWQSSINAGELTLEEWELLLQPYEDALQAYEDSLNADWKAYMALTREDLPQFYAYSVSIRFDEFTEFVQDESFDQIEITIGDQVYVQDVGHISLITDWDLPAPIDWTVGYGGIDGYIGGRSSASPYNDGVECLNSYFHFVASRYMLLEELVMLTPSLKVERISLNIKPAQGKAFVTDWDMSEPYEILPGDEVTINLAFSSPEMDTPGYQIMADAYLLYSTDGEQYLKFANCYIGPAGSHYFWNAVLFDGIDLEDYYWEYLYRFEEPWRYDPEAELVSRT